MARHESTLREYSPEFNGISLQRMSAANPNARCFMAIEVENRVSRKHLMGGAINAAALGRVGIVVGWSTEKMRALVRTRAYLQYLGFVGKQTFQTGNLLIMTPDDLEHCIE
jgi:hypothetical protein